MVILVRGVKVGGANKREILAQQAKERMESGRNQYSPSENLPEATKETRDAVAAEIGVHRSPQNLMAGA
jgi:hypothetical protein